MSLQQFRQMIGLQCSTGFTSINDRRIASLLRTSDNRRPYSTMNNNSNNQPLSSSSSSSSSSLTTSNIRLVNGMKQRSQETMLSQNYPSLPISPRMLNIRFIILQKKISSLDETLSMNFPGASGNSNITDPNLTSPVSTCQEMR